VNYRRYNNYIFNDRRNESAAECQKIKNKVNEKTQTPLCVKNIIYLQTISPRNLNLAPLLYQFNSQVFNLLIKEFACWRKSLSQL